MLGNFKVFNKKIKDLELRHRLFIGDDIQIDPKRQIKQTEKEILWNDAQCPEYFDPDYFKEDILGNICIKGLNCFNSLVLELSRAFFLPITFVFDFVIVLFFCCKFLLYHM